MLENVFKERGEEGSPDSPESPSGRTSFLSTALLFPVILLVTLGLIATLFGWIPFETRGALELAKEIRVSSGERRALVAYELSRLESYGLSAPERKGFLEDLEGLLSDASERDPRVKRALSLTLGRIGDASSRPLPSLWASWEIPPPSRHCRRRFRMLLPMFAGMRRWPWRGWETKRHCPRCCRFSRERSPVPLSLPGSGKT
jgi:hypothetical protein